MLQKEDYVIVIGASAGGMNAIIKVISALKADINAAVFVVIHLSRYGAAEILLERLQRNCLLTCSIAENGLTIETGNLYLAQANHHLIIKEDKILLGSGAQENRWRPSIDVTMRSAAAAWSSHAIGIILTGMLYDGTVGIEAIKRSGGCAIVQDPQDAEYPDMPNSALRINEIDHCLPASDIAAAISACMAAPKTYKEVPADLRIEAELAEKSASDINNLSQLGSKSNYTCPDCGGILWKVENGNVERYRCYTGHTYTENELLNQQVKSLESTLWVALRTMEERKNLLQNISHRETVRGQHGLAKHYTEMQQTLEYHIDRMKEVLFSEENPDEENGKLSA